MGITLKITWTTQNDGQVCPVCKALEGYIWTLKAGDPLPKQLFHPLYGHVYETRPVARGSLVKEEKGHVCRCALKHEFDLSPSAASDEATMDASGKPLEKKLTE